MKAKLADMWMEKKNQEKGERKESGLQRVWLLLPLNEAGVEH